MQCFFLSIFLLTGSFLAKAQLLFSYMEVVKLLKINEGAINADYTHHNPQWSCPYGSVICIMIIKY